ncbi:MAG TPA: HAD hydrolase-like protein [Tepidisphaeraceae bacterium]|nr:HAD hydrolase-like protein [Tepidisphaeraceae bacterium]
MALAGIILDLDGTLVDSNAMHVRAWRSAFEAHAYRIGEDRIWTEVGKGGDKLVRDILGSQADARDGDALRAAHPREFEKLARAEGIRPFDGAVQFIEHLRRRKLRTSIATSSGSKHFEVIESTSKVPWRSLVDAVVTQDDAKNSKPAPDPMVAALRKLELSPAQAAAVGDTIYDARAARAAGVVCLGLLSGQNSADEMRLAGARATYGDIGALLQQADAALELASPGPAQLTIGVLESLVRQAIEVAREGMRQGEAPIGCVLARGDGTVIARAFNRQNATGSKIAHAEIEAFAAAAGKAPLGARDLVMACTLEPCVMCTGAAMEAAVDTVAYALRAPADAGSQRVACPSSPESQVPRMIGGILADESRAMFEEWLTKELRPEQRRFGRQLLALTR